MTTDLLADILKNFSDLELTILIESRSTEAAQPGSDWDLAIR